MASDKKVKPDIIFVNPTPNIKKIAEQEILADRNIKFVALSQFMQYDMMRIQLCFNEQYFIVDDAPDKHTAEPYDRYLDIENSFFIRIRDFFRAGEKQNSITKQMTKFIPDVSNYTELEVNLLNQRTISYSFFDKKDKEGIETFGQIEDILTKNPKAIIVGNHIFNHGKLKIVSYDVEEDHKWVLDNEIIVYLYKNYLMYVYFQKDKLHIVSELDNPIEVMRQIIPSMNKFDFNKSGEINILTNSGYRIFKEMGIYLLNDYSYFNISINMPDAFYARVAQYIANLKK